MGTIKRWGIGLGLLSVIVLGWLMLRTSREREPVFEGRPLTSWLYHHVASSAAIPPYGSPGWRKADEALRTIGTNAVPTLLKMLRSTEPPPLVRKVRDFARQHRWIKDSSPSAMWRQEEAEYAFRVLGSKAVGAVPELLRIYQDGIYASSQSCAAQSLRDIGGGAQAALPALIRNFTHTNSNVRFDAVSATLGIGGPPQVLLPAFTSALKDPSVEVRWNALVGVEMLGSAGRAAVPEVLKMLKDPGMVGSSSIIGQVETTLWRIAPEKVGKPLVVEDATPMISNGVTTAALKLTFWGKRKTLIPPGKTVPTVAQYWNSDPRPFLTLYRGTASGAEDHLLGRFEVLGLAESENLNVSTLCVVADGKIFLCARNNHGDQFLQIRRVDSAAQP